MTGKVPSGRRLTSGRIVPWEGVAELFEFEFEDTSVEATEFEPEPEEEEVNDDDDGNGELTE